MDYGLVSMDYGLASMDYGLLSMDYGLLLMDSGLLGGIGPCYFGLLGFPGGSQAFLSWRSCQCLQQLGIKCDVAECGFSKLVTVVGFSSETDRIKLKLVTRQLESGLPPSVCHCGFAGKPRG